LKRLDLQARHPQFSKSILDGRSDAELFALLHQACWETGHWPSAYATNESPSPTTYVGLPMVAEVFDADELYAVLHQGALRLVFKSRDSVVGSAVIGYDDYFKAWRAIREDFARRIAETK
jgi:hypothetical protein